MTRAESDQLLSKIVQSIIDRIVPLEEEGTYGVNSEDASEWLWEAFQAQIAEAVQAERERCAKVAVERGQDAKERGYDSIGLTPSTFAAGIAAAIREGR